MSTQNDELRDKLSALFTDYVNIAAFAKGAQDIRTIDAVDRDLKKTLAIAESYISTNYLKKSEVLEAIEKLRLDDTSSSTEDYAHYTGNNTALWKLKQALGLGREGE